MKISIIIPVLNEQDNIELLMNSLAYINTDQHEIVVVDGGSKDETTEIVKRYPVVLVESKKGRAVQMNVGAQKSTGEILMFLHADTRLSQTCFEKLINHSMNAQWGWFNVRLSGNGVVFRVIEFMMNLRSHITHVATGDQCIFVVRSLYEKAGGYPSIPLMEDVALCKQLRKLHAPVIVHSIVTTSSRRWQENGVFKTMALMWWLRFCYFIGVSPVRLHKMYYSL